MNEIETQVDADQEQYNAAHQDYAGMFSAYGPLVVFLGRCSTTAASQPS